MEWEFIISNLVFHDYPTNFRNTSRNSYKHYNYKELLRPACALDPAWKCRFGPAIERLAYA